VSLNGQGIAEGRYPHRFLGSLLSAVIVLASTLLVVYMFSTMLLNAGLFYSAFCAVSSSLIFILRLRSFNEAKAGLLKNGFYNYAAHSNRKRRSGGIILLLGVVLLIYVPLLLVPYLEPVLWFTSLIGLMCGINIGELGLTFYVRRWELKRDVTLVRYKVYRSGDDGERDLSEWGIRAIRKERLHAGKSACEEYNRRSWRNKGSKRKTA